MFDPLNILSVSTTEKNDFCPELICCIPQFDTDEVSEIIGYVYTL